MVEMFFPGAEGKLQGMYEHQSNGRAVLILPPSPKYGGTMNNKVVYSLYESFVDNGFSTLRMNFRGVQKSAGKISNADSELIKDASAAINWLQEQNPIITEFWLAGFSFGAWMASNIVMRRPEVTGFIAIAPPVERYDFSFLMPCSIPGLVIQGDNDTITDHDEVRKLIEKLQAKVKGMRYHCISGGDYRLSTDEHLQEISEISSEFINQIISTDFIEESNDILEYALEEA